MMNLFLSAPAVKHSYIDAGNPCGTCHVRLTRQRLRALYQAAWHEARPLAVFIGVVLFCKRCFPGFACANQ